MELSHSKAETFRSCQKKYYWKYVQHLKPVTRDTALSLGAILHEAFDFFYKGASDQETYQYIADRFAEELKKEEVADQEDLIISKYTALGMWLNYPHKQKEYDIIASEESFKVNLFEGVDFIGKVDGRIQQFNNWWVREVKTTGQSLRQFQGRCQTSSQGTGYVFGLTPKYDIKGIMYEYIRKPILRKGVKETADDFGRRIMDDYKARPKFYFSRYPSYRTAVDLKLFKEDMAHLAQDILEKDKRGIYYRNPDQCWSFGQECPFLKICFAEEPDPLTLELYFIHEP
jgi:hypothetical protein